MTTDAFEPRPLLVVAAAALLDAQGRVLVQRRPPGTEHAGLWEFPGGKLEEGEAPAAALVRELREELGIAVDPGDLSPAAFASQPSGARHLLLLLFLCRRWRGALRLLQAAELRWLHPAALHALAMPPADAPLIATLERLL